MNSIEKFIKNFNTNEIIFFDKQVLEEKIKSFANDKNNIVIVAGKLSISIRFRLHINQFISLSRRDEKFIIIFFNRKIQCFKGRLLA